MARYPIDLRVEEGLVEVPETCDHGARPFMVDIGPDEEETGAWEVFVLYACEHGCIGEQALADRPRRVTDSNGREVNWMIRAGAGSGRGAGARPGS